ncbi:hydrophobe/amphiphile efflux-1 family RND transporter [Elizabethkingia anophelis]|uniref:Hydrophobe/amphiphile efflux-1 family RND transporter n=1 Tax=Elizabethkingia anophelis R26 TaxID=1246994 RepID=A0ABM6MX91_9FLAO|nr:efflux RND transporter permease subunit [Elizabethkingia anophelis]AQW93109.1 multidrug transporter AcrB [Elizabethkingia anophelis]ATC37591.1 hydrophobe/amphiphile efflux-1 family RND transporter [Elizabethkingia anophelis R26]ATC41270.1 hydrophobe/amphiphile efflux-1 family RND transporter [Elizabethkingia anophelis Ag1]ATC44947.1 hydrophobe/amphiphile efflux-1 family RND transporter [Elizabethkingia anophelis]ATC48623.1 hydrophobe/amphiphile efflux-1 family RND transporter [Elizabethking
MVEMFIRRKVLSLVISIIIVLLGVMALLKLPITQFPDIVPPSVTVTARYTGANAEVSANAVALPLERAINGVPGMTYMSTVTSNDGLTLIQVFFEVGTDPDVAAVNVQNRVTTVLDELPEEVIRAGVTTEKEVNSMLMYLNITSKDESQDEQFIYNFTDINILQELKRIDGVGRAEIMGQKEYSMRVWLDPQKMAAYHISADEVITSLQKQNIAAAPGKVGETSGKTSSQLQYVIKYTGKFFDPKQYEEVPIRSDANGTILKLKDIAKVEFGAMNYGMVSKTDGRPSASIMMKQRPGSNASEVIKNVKEKMAELKETSFPPGMEYNMAYDVSRFLDASIDSVLHTLIEAFILVGIVVFIFLQDWRSTLIPVLAVPVALIGTFAFMQTLDFSINLLTLFALVLAIGIVVDNAIVVVEAVHVKMEEGLSPLDATITATKEIAGAVVAITIVMSAVFIPVAFLDGPVGVFYRQFSLTLAISIVISGVNALTLTPALCAIILKPHDHNKKKNIADKLFQRFNNGFDKLTQGYTNILSKFATRTTVTFGLLFLFIGLTWATSKFLPGGFIPMEDQGMAYVSVTTPQGATVERTEKVLDEVTEIAKKIEGVENVTTLAGYSIVTEIAGASYGMAMINLKDWKDRNISVNEFITELSKKTKGISDAQIEIFAPPTVPGFGNTSGFELRLLDRSGGDIVNTDKVTKEFIKKLNEAPEIQNSFTSFDATFPQYMIHVDYDMAAKKGVSVDNAMSTLQTMLGSYYATNFIRFSQMYKVMVQASPEHRDTPESILNLYLKNDAGEMVPFSTFITIERVYGPEVLTRYNMYMSAMINGEPAEGYSSGDAIAAVERVAAETLPRGFDIEWSGMTREEILSGNQTVYIFGICLLFVYLLLAAQYESFLLPMPVLLSLPTGIFGSYIALVLVGLDNNIYAQVALVMLIGLLAKNAILIVEFAIARNKEGYDIIPAAIEGARQRLRPILMTSFAFVAGLIPLCIATGAGATGNRSIGIAAAGGMLIGTIFGLVIIPGLYIFFAKLENKKKDEKKGS